MNISEIIKFATELSNDDFIKLTTAMDKQKNARAQKILDEANQQIKALTGEPTLLNKKSNHRSLPPKYLDPASGKTWSGQGRQPAWFKKFLEEGGSESELLIP